MLHQGSFDISDFQLPFPIEYNVALQPLLHVCVLQQYPMGMFKLHI